MSIPAYLKYIGLTILFAVATMNFVRTTLDVIESSRRLDEMKSDVAGLNDENAKLQEELEYKKSEDFIEGEARNKLGLAKPGEELFVVEKVMGETSHNSNESGLLFDNFDTTNVEKWVGLFL